jgi:hypothetical protein
VRVTGSGADRLALNTPAFAVSPGTNFTADIPLGATVSSSGSGYVALIFLDAQGKEVRRDRLALEAGEKTLGKAVTDTSGRFQLKPGAGSLPRDRSIHAEFPGDTSLGGASVTLH